MGCVRLIHRSRKFNCNKCVKTILNAIIVKTPVTDNEFARYFNFRWRLLRKPLQLPEGSEQDEHEATSFHCYALNNDLEIVGVGRITPQERLVMQIRYMAVAENYRHQGVGSLILQSLLDYAKHNHAQDCWLNARNDACTFYEKNGFKLVKKIHTDLPIPHYRMEIRI